MPVANYFLTDAGCTELVTKPREKVGNQFDSPSTHAKRLLTQSIDLARFAPKPIPQTDYLIS
jgi:hypothetical protein